MAKERIVKIFDTTLRDGEQSPGATMNIQEKIKIAKQLAKLNVDIIEAGFPVSSPGDFEAVKQVSKEIEGPTICALARCLEKDIESAAAALSIAKSKRIHVFAATSAIHRKFKFGKAKSEILKMAVKGVEMAKGFVDDVEFSPEDAARTELPFLAEVTEAVIAAGAKTVNIPDTVGYSIPFEFGTIIKYLFDNVPNINDAVISVHCHNDLGLAVSNSIAAVLNGASQVECTINGLGERAGNCSMEEFAMALRTRKKLLGLDTKIQTEEFTKTSRLVSNITGIQVQPNKAIVGANAFAHEAGIHQDGMLKNRSTYEIMDPKDVGWGDSELVLGKHSGRHAFEKRLKALGYELSDEEMNAAFDRFKLICDKKKVVYDEDIASLVENTVLNELDVYNLSELSMDYQYQSSKTKQVPTAKVVVEDVQKGKAIKGSAKGDGPVDAIYKAIEKVTGLKITLLKYNIASVTRGQDAMGEVTVKINVPKSQIPFVGRGVSTDILEASALAYLQAINRAVKQTQSQKKG